MKISKRSKITSSKETADRKTDRRIFPTNIRYKGYMIRLDRGGDGYNVYDKQGELEDAGYASIEKAKEFVDELENEAKGSYVRSSIDEDSNWRELASKSVEDSDGFYTDYTLYTNGSTFICMFGDKDIYEPDQAYADYETENEEDAYDWFDNYEGFADEDDAEPEFDIYASESDSNEDDLVFIDNRKSSIVNNDPSLDPGFDEYDVYSSEDFEDHEDDLDHPDQEYDSAATSINSTKLPAIYRMIKLQPGTVGVDFGGGRFDNAVEYLRDQDVTLCVYDPYNRSSEHNREVLRTLRANGGADFAINSNVLNVIKEPEARKGVLENIKKITKSGAPIYITVYEGRGDAKEGVTKSGYQLNRKTADYLEEIQEVFPDAKRKGKLIVATNKGSANSSVDIKASSEIIWDDLDWNQQIQVMKRYIRNYKGTRIFEDFADYINKPVEDIIDSFTDAESHEDIKIPERMQLDSEYRNDDIYSSTTSSSRYWYFTRHGVQPGSVPKYVNILDIVDKPEGSYFLADGVILTKDLRDYDIKERKPEDSVTSSTRIKSKGNNQYTDADIVRSSKSIGKYFGLIYYTPDSGENGMEGDKFDLSDCGEFNSIEEANEFWHEYLLRDKGQAFVAEITKEEYEDWLAESELQKDWESSYKQSHGTVNGSTNEYSDILEEIREQCNTKLIHIMAQYGFDESEAKEYSRVDASIDDDKYGRIEIGCELDYDGLMKVCQELDPIVQAYDPDSYFEPVDSGIAEAWVNLEKASIDSSSNIQAGAYDFPEPSLDPPEYPEPEEVDDYTQKIDLNLDAVIEIDQLGNWEYQDENYPWARCKDTKDGSWYSDEYDVFIADPVSIVERVDELLISKLPEKEGTYSIKGNVHLEYVVSNLSKYVHSYGPDDYEEDIDTDNAYVDFDFYNSNISDFRLTKI